MKPKFVKVHVNVNILPALILIVKTIFRAWARYP